jgi:hypothetical protein
MRKSAPPKARNAANRHSIAGFSPSQKKRVSVKRVGSLGRETTLSPEECIVRVTRGADRVKDSNKKLVVQCKTTDVSSSFGEALRAIFENNLEVLGKLLNSELLSIESGDNEGNTLLHAAVACQRNDIVKLLCERGACVDAVGVSAIRPLHRAGVEGFVSIVHTLLERGASPNDLDSNLRSPLHFTAAVQDHLECSYALLERGARIYQKDALGVRPFDLNNSLKDMQSSLVTSVCENFQTTVLKDYEIPDMSEDSIGTVSSPTGTPNVSQLFPWGSRDRSWSSGSSSQGPTHTVSNLIRYDSQPSLDCATQQGSTISLLPSKSGSLRLSRSGSTGSLDQLSKLVQLANKRANKFNAKLKMKHSQFKQFSNEVFLEAEEDEMQKQLRKEKLKFPSDFGINMAAMQVGITATEMEQKLNALIRFGLLEGRRVRREKEEQNFKETLMETEATMDVKFKSSGEGKSSRDPPHPAPSPPQPRPSTSEQPPSVVRQSEDSRVKDTEVRSRKGSGSHTSSDTLVNTGQQDNSESGSIMTTSTQAMSRAFSDLQKAIDYDKYHSQIKAVASGNSEEDIPMISIAKHPLHHVPRYKSSKKDTLRKRPETDSVFDEIMADLQGDLPSYEAAKQPPTQSPPPEGQKSDTLRRTLGPPVDIDAMSVKGRRRSSSALVANGDGRGIVPVPGVHPRSMSFTSSGSSTALIYPHHHRRSSSQPFSMAPNEPGATALRSLIMLSSNEECLSRLIQYVSLPQFSTRLITLARSARSSCGMLANIATLLQNLYEVGGSEGRKKAVESGILSITVKLLRARDPIPGTMLQLLYSLLFSEEDPTNYLRAIARIPIAPLLSFLEPEDKDSGFENRQRDTSLSTPPSGSLQRSRSSTRVLPPELISPHETKPMRPREDSDGSSKNPDHHAHHLIKSPHPSSREANSTSGIETHSSRTNSFHSDPAAVGTTDSGGSSRSLTTPTLHGHSMTFTEAKRIALKLFAALSVYDKIHKELGDARVISLLVENLCDVSQENVTNAVVTLSNIAKNPNTHPLMMQCGVMDKLSTLLSNGPTIRHHSAKAMVYLGEMNTQGNSVFHRSNGYGSEEVTYKESKEQNQIWGATLEHLVNQLIEEPGVLWNHADIMTSRVGGFPHLHTPSEREITRFFLVTMRSFVDPLIFLRLLLHRLTSDETFLSFDGLESEGKSPELSGDVLRVLSIIEQWMQDCIDGHCSDDFIAQPILQKEIANLIQLLKQTKGFYAGTARNMKKLLDNIGKPHTSSFLSVNTERIPHHDHLYPVCQRMIVEGLLPVTLEQVVMMGGLQLHIESLVSGEEEARTTFHGRMRKKNSSSQLVKKALPAAYQKHKSIAKRLLEEKAKYAHLSERNSKHLYIEKCQSIPGYDYQFFEVTLKTSQSPSGMFFKKVQPERRLLGISDKQLILLDERTKHVLSQFSLKDVVRVTRKERSPNAVTVKLKDTQFNFVLEDGRKMEEMLLLLECCEENRWDQLYEMGAQDDLDDFDSSWPHHLLAIPRDPHGSRSVSPPTSNSSPTGSIGDLVNNLLRPAALGKETNGSGAMSGANHVTPDQLKQPPHNQDQPWRARERYNSDDDSEGDVQFQCDCPEDPELGPDFNMADIDLQSLLHCPLELARQITLIDHELLCNVSSGDILHKIRMAPKQVPMETRPLSPAMFGSSSTLEQTEGSIEKLAFRFNQIGNWVASSILFFDIPEERADVIIKFIDTAKHCFEMRNYSAVMAIVVLGLGSPSIRRLKLSWERVPEKHKDFLKKMNGLLDSKLNYSKYREMLGNTGLPAVPYFGVFLKDLTQIVENNPDYLKGGLINLVKRKQIYRTLKDVMSFKRQKYNYLRVHAIREYLLSVVIVPEDALHEQSHKKEPKALHASIGHPSFRSSRGSLSSLSSFSSHILRRFRHGSSDSIAEH